MFYYYTSIEYPGGHTKLKDRNWRHKYYYREINVQQGDTVKIKDIYVSKSHSFIQGTIIIDEYSFKIDKNPFWEQWNSGCLIEIDGEKALKINRNYYEFKILNDDELKEYIDYYEYNTHQYTCYDQKYTVLHGDKAELNLQDLIKDGYSQKISMDEKVGFSWSNNQGSLKITLV